MTRYNVHIYREMRLYYPAVEAESTAEAARIASQMETDKAAEIEDCNGDDLGALVDVVGDQDYANSEMIDFEPQRLAKAAPELLRLLKDAREAFLDGRSDDLRGILAGDVCSDAIAEMGGMPA
jgi:hypothetical protein